MSQIDLIFKDLLTLSSSRLESVFTQYLHDIPSLELKTAMEYTLFSNGKRIRPLLIYTTGCMFAAPWENLDVAATSVELLHTYSLIHDDLPCMDNANLRRGKPSCHKAFDEGIAVLTGDALHTLAMELSSRAYKSRKTSAINERFDCRLWPIRHGSRTSTGYYGDECRGYFTRIARGNL